MPRGDADALFNLGQAYRLGRGVRADPAMAQTYFLKSAIKGHAPAQERLGLTLFAKPETRIEGLRWLTQAAARDEERAQYALGVAYFNGDGVKADRALGYAYMRRAEKSGMAEATGALAAMLARLTPAEKSRGEQLQLPLQPQGVATTAAAAAPAPVETPAAAPPPEAVAVQPEPAARSIRVQIGAFASRAEATARWTALTAAQKTIVGPAPPIITERDGIVRLQVGPYPTRSAAQSICKRLNAARVSCFVVTG